MLRVLETDGQPAPEEWVTVREAAAQLGIPERSLRRLIERGGYTGQTRQESRQTKTGTRQTTLLPAALLVEIASQAAARPNAAEGGTEKPAGTRQASASASSGAISAYHRLLESKDAEIARLETALKDSQAALHKALDALAREQALRAISAAPETAPPAGRRLWWAWWRRDRKESG